MWTRHRAWIVVLLLGGALTVLAACGEETPADNLETRVSKVEEALKGIQAQLEVPTPMPQPTATPQPAATPQPTPSPQPTATPMVLEGVATTPPQSLEATVNAENGLNVRAEPTIEAEVLQVLDHQQEVLLTGRSATSGDAEWVELQGGGWVQSQYMVFN